MLAALVTFTFEPDDAAAPLDPGTGTAGSKEGLPGLLSRIDWRDTANHRSGSIYVWASRDPAVVYYDEAFMERCERTVGIRPSVEFLEVTAILETTVGTRNAAPSALSCVDRPLP